jgi:hypothetical protein
MDTRLWQDPNRREHRAGPMPTLAAKFAPQRSTQYAALASALAAAELRLSPLGSSIGGWRPVELAGQAYVLLELTAPPTAEQERALWQMGATSEFFWFHEAIGDLPGPFLQPLSPVRTTMLPAELVEARRYRGKTNELFGEVLLNLARWAHPGEPAAVLDPLMGGGTLLFLALRLGLHAVGIEQAKAEVERTDSFLEGFLKEAKVRYRRTLERPAGGRRWLYAISPSGTEEPLQLALVQGDSVEAPALLAGLRRELRPDLLVTDLPYGIQHQGQVERLLTDGLAAWTRVLAPRAVLAFAWDATHLPRARVVEWVEASAEWAVLQGGAWEELSHSVDRVIKRREVLVARRTP